MEPKDDNGLREIALTKGRVALVDDSDYERISSEKWFASTNGYAVRTVRMPNAGNIRIHMHRTILGISDASVLVDHINGDGLDNRRSNLRICSKSENLRNRGKPASNTSGYKGVAWSKAAGKWQAYITVEGKRKHLGLFETPEAGHAAYCEAATKLHGEFANFGA